MLFTGKRKVQIPAAKINTQSFFKLVSQIIFIFQNFEVLSFYCF